MKIIRDRFYIILILFLILLPCFKIDTYGKTKVIEETGILRMYIKRGFKCQITNLLKAYVWDMCLVYVRY
jgi:hypothetical protein